MLYNMIANSFLVCAYDKIKYQPCNLIVWNFIEIKILFENKKRLKLTVLFNLSKLIFQKHSLTIHLINSYSQYPVKMIILSLYTAHKVWKIYEIHHTYISEVYYKNPIFQSHYIKFFYYFKWMKSINISPDLITFGNCFCHTFKFFL